MKHPTLVRVAMVTSIALSSMAAYANATTTTGTIKNKTDKTLYLYIDTDYNHNNVEKGMQAHGIVDAIGMNMITLNKNAKFDIGHEVRSNNTSFQFFITETRPQDMNTKTNILSVKIPETKDGFLEIKMKGSMLSVSPESFLFKKKNAVDLDEIRQTLATLNDFTIYFGTLK